MHGIHVPLGATLNLYGDGTLIAYGGDAGDGGGAVSGNTGGGRRRSEEVGAGAGIGGNGGTGGNAGSTFINWSVALSSGVSTDSNSGEDGESGEDCGNINIFDELIIYAYGGAGGAGGTDTTNNSGAGAGGYPAAGIGRWRSWPVVVEIMLVQQENILWELQRAVVKQVKMD